MKGKEEEGEVAQVAVVVVVEAGLVLDESLALVQVAAVVAVVQGLVLDPKSKTFLSQSLKLTPILSHLTPNNNLEAQAQVFKRFPKGTIIKFCRFKDSIWLNIDFAFSFSAKPTQIPSHLILNNNLESLMQVSKGNVNNITFLYSIIIFPMKTSFITFL